MHKQRKNTNFLIHIFQINQISESYFSQMQPRKLDNRIDFISNGFWYLLYGLQIATVDALSSGLSSTPSVRSNTVRNHEKLSVHKSPHSPFSSSRVPSNEDERNEFQQFILDI